MRPTKPVVGCKWRNLWLDETCGWMQVDILLTKLKVRPCLCDRRKVWLDASGGLCVDERGAKEISVRTTGHDKLHVTVMLTGRADGFKCRPFVLLPRKRPDKEIVERYKNKLIISWSGTVWMNDEITEEYLNKIYSKYIAIIQLNWNCKL
jgi:hypothetical protein